MKQNEKYLKEGLDILNREFGQPLPTLEDTMKAHKLKQEGGPGSGPKPKKGSAKDIDRKMSAAVDDANARLDAAEKEMERKAKAQAFKDMEKDMKEGPDDVRFARRALSKVVKSEQAMRKAMMALEQSFLRDPRPENQKLAKQIKKAYKSQVTKFMRDSVQMLKRMK